MLKVLEIALSESGYLEKASLNFLDDKTKNAGSGNYTKYARDLDAIKAFYNGKKQGYAWCDVFVDWCFVTAYGVTMAKKLLCQPSDSYGASCSASANYFKRSGQFYKTNPQIGDQIFFIYNGVINHTGLVYAVNDKYVYTIEGNTSGASGVIPNGGGVCKKQYSKTYHNIAGYGRPNYAFFGDQESGENSESKEVKCMIEMFQLQKGSKGNEVVTLQILLENKFRISCGKYGADGDFGAATETAVKTFQGNKKLMADGVVGKNTWNALLK